MPVFQLEIEAITIATEMYGCANVRRVDFRGITPDLSVEAESEPTESTIETGKE